MSPAEPRINRSDGRTDRPVQLRASDIARASSHGLSGFPPTPTLAAVTGPTVAAAMLLLLLLPYREGGGGEGVCLPQTLPSMTDRLGKKGAPAGRIQRGPIADVVEA